MSLLPKRWVLAAMAAAVMMAAPVAYGQTDPADLAFWQSIQTSTDPAEYRTYLQAFPTGTFASLARARLARLLAGDVGGLPSQARPVPGPARVVAPAPSEEPVPEPAAVVEEQLIVTPQPGRVGDLLKFTCVKFPKPFYLDAIVVVRAGSPENNPGDSRDDMKILARGYPQTCRDSGYVELGPFAPGRYEVRYVTGLYNDDHKVEIRTRTLFQVR